MEFGFSHTPCLSYSESVELIRFAESLGYTWAWVADQTFYRDPYVVLAAAALATKNIKLGIGVTNPYTRHPAMTARLAATLDEIAPGRFALGIGAGNQRELIAPLGINAEAPARACWEAIQILRAFWSGQPVMFEGEDFKAGGVQLEFAARPDIPIYIGGRGPQILSMAGREADGVILSLAGLDRAWELVENGAKSIGRDPDELHRVAWVKCAVLDSGADVDRYRVRVAHVLGRAPKAGLRIIGLTEDEIKQIKGAFEKGGSEAAAENVSDQMLRNHVVFGASDECASQIKELARKGIDVFSYQLIDRDFESMYEALETFADQVIARVTS